jgi:V/A-type H+-transporting ATPase subunit A
MRRGSEIEQMMKVVCEEGTSIEDFIIYMKGELVDSVYFQQNSFDPVDAAVKPERQKYVFSKLLVVLASQFEFANKEEARSWFNRLRQRFLDYNGCEWQSDRFKTMEAEIDDRLKSQSKGLDKDALKIIE